jgi:hypothetical protein
MRSQIIKAAIACLASAGLIMASVPMNSLQNQWITKGYITIGRNVIVLPARLQTGDRIDFYNMNGSKVFEQYVGTGYLAASMSKLPVGIYNLIVFRKGEAIAFQKVPIVGREVK